MLPQGSTMPTPQKPAGAASYNPFDLLYAEIASLKEIMLALQKPPENKQPDEEYITEAELCQRFGITRPTARKWAKEKKIKVLRFGASKRYRWTEVLAKLNK
jgi:excisionase family DNA binding protein